MLEDSVSSAWESMANWFTPTVLFLFLNLMIAIIAFTSSLNKQNSSDAADNVSRSTKVPLLHRLKSTNLQAKHQTFDSDTFYDGIESHTHYLFQHTTPSPIQSDPQILPDSNLETQPSIGIESDGGAADFDLALAAEKEEAASITEIYNQVMGNQIDGVRSAEEPKPEEIKVKMRKSASLRFDFRHAEEKASDDDGVEARRPATVRERGSSRGVGGDGDEEVDARADDFINKFKHQLKLQRLESILRAGGAKI